MRKRSLWHGLILFLLLISQTNCGVSINTPDPTSPPSSGRGEPFTGTSPFQPGATAQATPRTQQPQTASTGRGQELAGGKVIDVVDVVERTRPAVVSIVNLQSTRSGRTLQEVGSGSGVIISKDGLIVTNNHVIENEQGMRVTLPDGRSFQGTLIGADPSNDLAVIKINPAGQDLPVMAMGNNSDLRIGQTVIAIGNALALPGGPTVTTGVISALGRSIEEQNGARLTGLIQTDAAINPGNSGGALIDLQGRLIGINTAIAQAPGGGIGFAISIDTVKSIGEVLIQRGQGRRTTVYGCIGISDYAANTPTIAGQYGLDPNVRGVVVVPTPNGPAAQAGIRRLDIIAAINGQATPDETALLREIRKYTPGQAVTVTVVRSGQRADVRVTLTECNQ